MTGKDLFYGLELQMRIIIRYVYLPGTGRLSVLATRITTCHLGAGEGLEPHQQQGGIHHAGCNISLIHSRVITQ